MKKSFLCLTVGVMSLAANAQYTNFSPDSKFCDNWSIGIEGGIQTNLNQFHTPQGGVFGINLNKDINPYFGLSIEALGGVNNTGNWMVPQGHFHNGTAIDNLTGFFTGRWNVTNTIGGFNGGRRVFEIETNVGIGYGKFFTNKNVAGEAWNALQFKTGLNLNFYIGEARAWAINIKPAVVWNVSQPKKLDSYYGVGQLTAGVTYHFKTSNGTHFIAKSDVSQLQEEIAEMAALNAALEAQLAAEPVIEQEVIVEKIIETVPTAKTVTTVVNNTYIVNFAFNSAELVGDAKSTLDKIPAGSNVTLAGYASPEGNSEYNLKLSDRRAEAVKTYLESRGVKVEKTTGYGADNAESNRIVIVTVK